MQERTASCCCGDLLIVCRGDPLRISICHCLDCQRRTGSVFSTNARFAREAVRVVGPSKTYWRKGDSGNDVTFHFCPECASTVFWTLSAFPDLLAVAVGAFGDQGNELRLTTAPRWGGMNDGGCTKWSGTLICANLCESMSVLAQPYLRNLDRHRLRR